MDLIELETLHAWLTRAHGPERGMPYWHGYLAAIVVGPEAIMPSQWLPPLIGGNGENLPFADEVELRFIHNLVMRTYTDVARMAMATAFKPYLSSVADGLEQWCRGFANGMSFWYKDLKDEDKKATQDWLLPIVFLADKKTALAESVETIGRESADRLFAELPHQIKSCVPALRKYFMK